MESAVVRPISVIRGFPTAARMAKRRTLKADKLIADSGQLTAQGRSIGLTSEPATSTAVVTAMIGVTGRNPPDHAAGITP